MFQKMDLSQTLTTCDREPIHIPGSIQQHGLLLAVDERDFRILQVSNNTEDVLGTTVDQILGNFFENIVGPTQFKHLQDYSKNFTSYRDINPMVCKMPVKGKEESFDVTLHKSEDRLIIIEFERSFKRNDHHINYSFFYRAQEAITKIPHRDNIIDLFQEVAKHVKQISEFDRVLVYKFHEDLHGEVIAESKRDDLESLLGLHYPASDIPAQARKLYEKNWFRIIPNTNYTPIPIIPTINPITKKPIDLTHAVLRSVSPVHIEYLKNMGLGASMSISILHDGKLWGLIACHHYVPKLLPYEHRMSCTFVGQVVSWHLVSVLENDKRRRFIQRRNLINELMESMTTSSDWMAGLKSEEKRLCELVEAHGATIHFYHQFFQYGITPSLKEFESLHKIVENEMETKKQNLLSTNYAASLYPGALNYPNIVSGLLAISIPGEPTGSVIWYRPQAEQTVSWGGKPEKMEDVKGVLHPRKSFAIWTEEVKNKSLNWSDTDKLVAEEFRNLTMEILVKHEINQFKNAEALNKKQEEFIDTICHEIRNPINGIIGSLGLIREKLVKVKEHLETSGVKVSELTEIDAHLTDIMDCAVHQTTVTTDALDLSKLDFGKMKLENVPIDLEALVQSVVKIFINAATSKGIELAVESLSPVYMKGDPHRLKQIIINLVSNAIKFTEQGGVTIRFKEADRGDNNMTVVITVEDTGIGMSDAETMQLFNRFSQANESIASRYGGSGLGLSISRKLARLMGGDIVVTSRQNVGSKFTVRISSHLLNEEDIESLVKPSRKNSKEIPRVSESKMKKTILIVEDNVLNQRILVALLKKYNYTCIIAHNGLEAIQEYMLHSSELDVIFMDIEMPVMNGYEATKIIREKEKELQLPAIPVIGLSGNAREQQKLQALSIGMTDYLTKPFSGEDIVAKINSLVK